jgi:hypothetical protein
MPLIAKSRDMPGAFPYSIMASAPVSRSFGNATPSAAAVFRIDDARRLQHQQFRTFGAAKYFARAGSRLQIGVVNARPVTQQSANFRELAPSVDGWHRVAHGKRNEAISFTVEARIAANEKSPDLRLDE